MSEERPVLHVPKMGATQTIGINKAREIAENKEELTDAELEAKLTRVLERGIIIDATTVDLPPGVYGEWVSDEAAEISRMQILGFEIDTKYAVDRSMNAEGEDGIARIGDVIFMTCPQRVRDMTEKVRKQLYDRANPKAGSQREEQEFKSSMKAGTSIPVIDESVASQVDEAGILAALEASKSK